MTSTENMTNQKLKQNHSGKIRIIMRVVALLVPLSAVVLLVVLIKYRSPSYLPEIEFVQVSGGCYEMGCGPWADDCHERVNPLHEVCVDDFAIGKYEVTQAQWKAVMGYNPANKGHGGDYPVEWVSWEDIQVFMEKLTAMSNDGCTYRLPTEAEWEYAARSGGKSEKYSGGDDIDHVAWYGANSGRDTHPVGSKAPNGLGIHDMSGNVWEWCLDMYYPGSYDDHRRDNPLIRRGDYTVLRGGSFLDVDVAEVQTANRSSNDKERGFANCGFRIVRVPKSY